MGVATVIYYFLLLNILANGFYHGLIFLFIKIKKGNIDQDITHVKLEYNINK
jgi:hypothetical protein